ncbi:hypothetical protein D918_00703 [Trichuris suis]|nr:hypothetical protein D918_00703 [Trichuris suis]
MLEKNCRINRITILNELAAYRRYARKNSELSTIKTLEKTIEKPDCVYTIRRDTVNGPIVKFATLGMDIVHRWECESPERDGENVYAMHVHSCYIKSETQEQVMVIDENGSSIYICSLTIFLFLINRQQQLFRMFIPKYESLPSGAFTDSEDKLFSESIAGQC